MIDISPFSAQLREILPAEAAYLPLSPADTAKLLSLLPDGEETILTIYDNMYQEEVKVTNQCGSLVVERGQGGTTPQRFPRYSEVCWRITTSYVQWLICNYDCCASDCPCEPVTSAGSVFPNGRVDEEWNGNVIFKGTLPMVFGVTNLPTWAEVEQGPNYVRIYGTPTSAQSWTVAVAATNCSGTGVAVVTETISIGT